MNNNIHRLAVCLKLVHDIVNPVRFLANRELDPDSITRYVMNPQDEFALEEALRLKAQIPGCRVSVISLGNKTAETALRYGLAAGADEALRIWDPLLEEADPFVTGLVLAKAIKQISPCLVFCGSRSSNLGRGLVPSMMAEMLGFACISHARNTRYLPLEQKLRLDQKTERHTLTLKLTPPAVLSVRRGFPLRYPKLTSRFKARNIEIQNLSLSLLGTHKEELTPLTRIEQTVMPKPLKKASVPTARTGMGRLQAIMNQAPQKPRSDTSIFEGDPRQVASQTLAALLENQAISLAEIKS